MNNQNSTQRQNGTCTPSTCPVRKNIYNTYKKYEVIHYTWTFSDGRFKISEASMIKSPDLEAKDLTFSLILNVSKIMKKVTILLSFLNKSGKVITSLPEKITISFFNSSIQLISDVTFYPKVPMLEYPCEIPINSFEKNVLNNNKCIITMINLHYDTNIVFSEEDKNDNFLKSLTMSHARNFEKLLDNENLSDVMFTFPNNQKIYAHKNILVCESTFFQSKLTPDSKKNIFNLSINYHTFKEALRFIYGANIEITQNNISEFIAISEKYGIQLLKDKCEENCYNNMNVHNVKEMFALANLHNFNLLKTKAISLILGHFNMDVKKFKEMSALDQSQTLSTFSKYLPETITL